MIALNNGAPMYSIRRTAAEQNRSAMSKIKRMLEMNAQCREELWRNQPKGRILRKSVSKPDPRTHTCALCEQE